MFHKISAVTLDNPHKENDNPAVLASIQLGDNAAVPTHAGSAWEPQRCLRADGDGVYA